MSKCYTVITNSEPLPKLLYFRYAYSAELAGIGYSLANTKSGLTLAVKGYSDKQGVLLNKIMDKLTGFKVDPARFTILKEL